MAKNILIVDDSATVRETLNLTLSKAGYAVTTAKDGADALNMVDSGHFDLLMTDLNMPNMNGIEFISKVRKLAYKRFTPIIILSGESKDQKKRIHLCRRLRIHAEAIQTGPGSRNFKHTHAALIAERNKEEERMDIAENLTTQFLTFALGQDAFAADVRIAKEIVDYTEVTQVPQTPGYLLGVINLRGAVVPVIDMRLKFGMTKGETTQNSCIIVMEVEIDGDIVTVGALVDSVQEVMDLNESQIEPPPKIGTKMNTDYIKGMGNMGEKFLIILDINKIFSVDELELVQDLRSEEIAV